MAIKCPKCGSLQTTALYTKETNNGRIRRRKICEDCGIRFTTYEVYIAEMTDEEQAAAFRKYARKVKGL